MDDTELLARLARGDEAAYDTIFRAWYAPLVRAAAAIVRDGAVAEELVQDVMLELWRRREGIDTGASIQGYLFRSVRNRALNHLRHLRVAQRTAPLVAREEEHEATGPLELVAGEIDVALRQAVAELTPRCREVFELSRVHGLRYAEIADQLGVSVKAVEAQMGKALKTLRIRLAPWLPKGEEL